MYDRQYKATLERKDDFEAYDKLFRDYPTGRMFSNWSKEELEYFSNEDRFPILKEGYQPPFDLKHPNWSKKESSRPLKDAINNSK